MIAMLSHGGNRGEAMATKLDEDERAALNKSMAIIEAFRAARPTMPLQHAYALMLVAMDEGKGVMEYAERSGVAQTVMTRHLLDLGTHTRRRDPGLGLVTQRMDPMDNRRHQTFLTPSGRALVHKVIRAVRV